MRINIGFFVVVFAISGLMIPTYSMNTFAASDDTGTMIAKKAGEIIVDEFWHILGWYLTLAEYYDDEWERLYLTFAEPEKTESAIMACTNYGKDTLEYINSASDAIDEVNSDGKITPEEIENFGNNHPELIESTSNWSICMIEVDAIWKSITNMKTIAFVKVWLLASDAIYGEKASPKEKQPDLNTIRRDQAALEALFTLKTAELLTGQEAANAAAQAKTMGEELSPAKLVMKMAKQVIINAAISEAADAVTRSAESSETEDVVSDIAKGVASEASIEAAKEAIRLEASGIILKVFATKASNNDITTLVNSILSPADNAALPPYLEKPKQITKKFSECMTTSSLEKLPGCATTLYTDVADAPLPDFSTLQEEFKNCEGNEKCESFFGERFGPSFDEIKKIGKIIECVELKGDADDCSSLLHIDKKLYSVGKECTTTNNEANCLNSMMEYTGFGDKIACFEDKFDACMDSEEPPNELRTQYENALKDVEAKKEILKNVKEYSSTLSAATLAADGRTPDPVSIRNTDGTVSVFAVGANNNLVTIRQTSANSDTWTDWTTITPGWVIQPTVAQNQDGRLVVFAVNENNSLVQSYQKEPNSNKWSNWETIGTEGIVQPTVSMESDGKLSVFAVKMSGGDGKKNNLLVTTQTAPNSKTWTEWNNLGGWVIYPTVTTDRDGHNQAFVVGSDGSLWRNVPNQVDNWGRWAQMGQEAYLENIIATRNDAGDIVVFGLNADNGNFRKISSSSDGKSFGNWDESKSIHFKQMDVEFSASGSRLVFGIGGDDCMWQVREADGWTASKVHPSCDSSGDNWFADPELAKNQDGRLVMFAVGFDNKIWASTQTAPNSKTWTEWITLGLG